VKWFIADRRAILKKLSKSILPAWSIAASFAVY
jgi:hypothetical protein